MNPARTFAPSPAVHVERLFDPPPLGLERSFKLMRFNASGLTVAARVFGSAVSCSIVRVSKIEIACVFDSLSAANASNCFASFDFRYVDRAQLLVPAVVAALP